jgi:HK97 gp10 family phage protein
MAETVSIDLFGDRELISAFEQLPEAIENRVLKYALREAAKPILQSARANAPRATGALKKSIKIRTMKRKKGRVGFTVGSSARDIPEGKEFYGYFQEKGWVTGKRTSADRQAQKKGIERTPKMGQRRIPGKFYVRRAFDAHKELAKAQMRELILKGLEREAERLAKKMKTVGLTPVV